MEKPRACLLAEFGDQKVEALAAFLDLAGFRKESRPGEENLFFRKSTGGFGNYTVVVLVWVDSKGNVERLDVN